ncbi:MAG: hypothetical protein JSS72_00220 [Armatimonadetes bacterium]|nr:hypothetical protein [Armatimonadota bacterium]
MARLMMLSIASLTLLALAGCQPSATPYVGDWKGSRVYQIQPGDNALLAKHIAEVKLTVYSNGTFKLYDGGLTAEGRLDVDSDGSAKLRILTMLSVRSDMDESKFPKVTKEGDKLVYRNGLIDSKEAELTKVSATDSSLRP